MRNLVFFLLMVFVCSGAWAVRVFAAEADYGTMDDAGGWMEIDGETVQVFYLPGANLRKLEARLRTRSIPLPAEYRQILSDSSYPMESRIALRMHALLLRAEEILGMKPNIKRIDVKVFRSRRDLGDEYERLFRSRKEHKSFYYHTLRGVFTSEQDMIDSIIAHEFGHAVVDHYFRVPPPPKIAELLATYVDEHLEGY
jgi:hypothetical protein